MTGKIINQIHKTAPNAPVIVIVPNGFVPTAQSFLLRDCNCLLNIRVVTFKNLFRLLRSEAEAKAEQHKRSAVLRSELSSDSDGILDNKTATLFLWRAIYDVRKKLTWLNKNVNQYAFAEKLMAAITQFNEEQININNLPQSPKFNDIKIISNKYKKLAQGLFCDSQVMDWLADNIYYSGIIQASHIFVLGFQFPTKQQSKVFNHLSKHSKGFVIDQPQANTPDSFIIKCENVFDESERVANAIRKIINDGVRYNEIKVLIDKSNRYIYENTFTSHNIPFNSFSNSNCLRLPQLDISACKTVADFCDSYSSATELQPTFEKIKMILGTMPISFNEFLIMAKAFLTQQSQNQSCFDRVTLTSVQEFIPHDVPYLFITNATEGTFPKLKNDNGIITQKDNIGIDLQTINAQIRAEAHSILTSATKQLFMTYALTNSQGEHTSISEFVLKSLPKIQTLDENFASPAFARNRVMSAIGSGKAFTDPTYWASIQAALDLETFHIPDLDKAHANISNAKQLFLPDNTLRVTQIENFIKCPFNHFLTQGLKLNKKSTQTLPPSDVGTILHKFAEIFAKNTNADVETILTSIISKYEIVAFQKRALLNRCKQIAKFLTADIETSQYKPTLFEHPVKSDFDGITLRGVIDRVDTNGKHAIAIDYKSGSVSDPKLQLPLYMKFISKKYIPDEAYYLSLKSFKKTAISTEEIEPATSTTKEVIHYIRNGVIHARPYDKNICKYCPAGAMCRKRYCKTEDDE